MISTIFPARMRMMTYLRSMCTMAGQPSPLDGRALSSSQFGDIAAFAQHLYRSPDGIQDVEPLHHVFDAVKTPGQLHASVKVLRKARNRFALHEPATASKLIAAGIRAGRPSKVAKLVEKHLFYRLYPDTEDLCKLIAALPEDNPEDILRVWKVLLSSAAPACPVSPAACDAAIGKLAPVSLEDACRVASQAHARGVRIGEESSDALQAAAVANGGFPESIDVPPYILELAVNDAPEDVADAGIEDESTETRA
jgi:hypothetical protein